MGLGGRVSRRSIAAGLVGLALIASACSSAHPGSSGSGGSAASSTNSTVTYAYGAGEDFTWIFPIENSLNSEPWIWDVSQMMYRPLYFEGQGSEPIINNSLSIAYPPVWSDGNKTVTINLKHYMWSDGLPVTSRDVEMWFNLEAANKTQNDFYTKGQLPDDVKSIDYPSSTQIVMHLTRSYSQQWFDENQLTWIVPMPQQEWDRTSVNGPDGNYDMTTAGAKAVFSFMFKESRELSTYATNPLWKVVDGPWRLAGYDPTTYRTTLVPNTKYSGPDKPKISKFVIESFTSNTAEADALRSGSVTYGFLTDDEYGLKSYFEQHGYTIEPWFPQYIQWAELGYTNKTYGPLVRQLYVRQALQHLVNEPLYADTLDHGLGQLTYGPVPNTPGSPYVSPQEKTDAYPYSVSAARALLTSHGWTPGPSGYMVCTHPGTAANECGAGIKAGRQFKILLMYATGSPTLLAEVESYVTSAKSAGMDFTLDPQSSTTMFSIGGVCPPGPCNWGMLIYGDWMWDYGQGAILPSGDTDFYTGNYWAGGYSSPTADALINAERYSSGYSHVFAFENYIRQQAAAIFFPTEGTWSVVKDGLNGWQQENAYGYIVPSQWYFSK